MGSTITTANGLNKIKALKKESQSSSGLYLFLFHDDLKCYALPYLPYPDGLKFPQSWAEINIASFKSSMSSNKVRKITDTTPNFRFFCITWLS